MLFEGNEIRNVKKKLQSLEFELLIQGDPKKQNP